MAAYASSACWLPAREILPSAVNWLAIQYRIKLIRFQIARQILTNGSIPQVGSQHVLLIVQGRTKKKLENSILSWK